MRGPLDIAIAGAGPAGLATALYLSRLGHRVTIFERFDAPRPLGSGLILQPTGQAVLADLGLLTAMRELGQRIDRLDGRDARTKRTVLAVRYDALKGGPHGLGVYRAALFSVLHEAAVAAGIAIATASTIAGIEPAAGKTCLVLGGGRREGPFHLIVDCSGAGTPLRRFARSVSPVKPLAFGAVWATVPWPGNGFDPNGLMQRYRRASVMIGVLPIGRHRVGGEDLAAFFWSLRADGHEKLRALGFEGWREQVIGLWPETAPLLATIGGLEALTFARYQHGTMAEPIGENLAFVGDSAHSTSPQLGQGANMALLDAKALAIALESAPDLGSALKKYAVLRRWHVRLYQALSRSLTPFYQSDSRVLPVLRDLLVAYVARIPPAPRFLAAMVAGNLVDACKALDLPPP